MGTIDSDDFESESFDVIFNERFNPLSVKIVYKNFNNEEQQIMKSISLRAYTSKEAVEKGILKKNNAFMYVGIFILLLIIWFIFRIIRRRRINKI